MDENFEIFEIDQDCGYCERSYYEYDTGYAEYECLLYGGECVCGSLEYGCPLSFKYSIEE